MDSYLTEAIVFLLIQIFALYYINRKRKTRLKHTRNKKKLRNQPVLNLHGHLSSAPFIFELPKFLNYFLTCIYYLRIKSEIKNNDIIL